MKKIEWLITWLTPHISALYHFLGGITVSLVLGIPIVFLFGDTLLSLLGHGLTVLGHGLHFLFEVFESITGHILEEAFHLHKRTAEIIFFWTSLAVAIGLSWYLMRKVHRAALQAVTTVQERRLALAEASKIILWIRIALIKFNKRNPLSFHLSPGRSFTCLFPQTTRKSCSVNKPARPCSFFCRACWN